MPARNQQKKEDEAAHARMDEDGAPPAKEAPAKEEKKEAPVADHAEKREERLAKAKESSTLEIRPETHPGIHSDGLQGEYSVDRELAQQWPEPAKGSGPSE